MGAQIIPNRNTERQRTESESAGQVYGAVTLVGEFRPLRADDVNGSFLPEEGTLSHPLDSIRKEYKRLRNNPDKVPDFGHRQR